MQGFDISFSALKTRIRDRNVFAQVGAVGGVLSQNVFNPVVRVGPNVFAQIDGNPLPNAPSYNLNIAVRYGVPLNDNTRLFVSGDFNMQGTIFYTVYKAVEYRVRGNYELGARAGIAFGDYEVAAFVTNLTNQLNLVGVTNTSNYRAGIYNVPRVVGVSLNGRFR